MAQSRVSKHNADSICANQNRTATNRLIIILQHFGSFYLSDVLYTLSMEMRDCRQSDSILLSIKYIFKASPWDVKTSLDRDPPITESRLIKSLND